MNHFKKPFPQRPEIRVPKVRLLDETGALIGIVLFKEAQALAYEKNLDLVEISTDADPPVYKIADYGKLAYHERKKKMEMRKKQKIVLMKEIQLSPRIQQHDYQVKCQQAIGFLENKDKVKLILQFRGRELSFVDEGKKIIENMIQALIPYGKVEGEAKLEGRRMIAILVPHKEVKEVQKKKDPSPVKEALVKPSAENVTLPQEEVGIQALASPMDEL